MHPELPPALERRCLPDRPPPRAGRGVVVWLRVAVRGHENPALDVGRLAAAALGVPLLVYHAVSERYPHASDRHHAFILQGARDLAHELDAAGISAAFHVERPGHRGPVLRQLCEDAALVVTDAMPLDPLRSWTRALARTVPVWEVDSSCVVPLPTFDAAPTRAFRYRQQARPHWGLLGWPWPAVTAPVAPWEQPLPFEPVDLREADLAALIGACAIDHTVPPVPDTPGGSRAGYARWDTFREHGLAAYPRARNDAARPHGVSRLSAYLHYGHVSPFRIAREASEAGAEKFLDELLVWRELAWHACHHTEGPRAFESLPGWARATLEGHAGDPRSALPLEVLEDGRTGSALWDAAQRSLLRHGELHNNVRMTWGKALLPWSRGPRQTLARLFELNDRLALDGRDPASVGGLTWCLGATDRPFEPAGPVFGTVRTRSLEQHEARLDLERYGRWVDRPLGETVPRVLVIGAGIAGCAAARTLHRMGVPVDVVDKARGPGGRMSTRRTDGRSFDHGAPSFTARDPRFLRQVRLWESSGVAAPWSGRAGRWDGVLETDALRSPRWVGVPRMSALVRHVLGEVQLRAQVRITGLERVSGGWTAHGPSGPLGTWDRVILTAPAPQSEALLRPSLPELADRMADVGIEPCWAALIDASGTPSLDAIRVEGAPLSWMARQDTLPGRGGPERWVVHASPDWSREHLEDPAEAVARTLGAVFAEVTGTAPDAVTAHRWRYARVTRPVGTDVLAADGVLVAGDGLRGGRVEDAWLSGTAAAGAILRELTLS